MIRVLSAVPNVTGAMLAFDGSAEDIERFGYFFEEAWRETRLPARPLNH